MGRHKFEDQFKDKLAQREIKPSAESWDKLSGQLDSVEKKEKPVFWWIGIAATLLGAIFLAGMVFNNQEVDSPVIVDNPVKIEKEDSDKAFEKNVLVAEENRKEEPSEKVGKPSLLKEKVSQPVKQRNEATVIAEVKKENSPVIRENEMTHRDKEISKKLEEIIAEVPLKDATGEHINDEVEALLYKAASEISLAKKHTGSNGHVDAGDLLFAIEMELEQSFREKVFDILKESYLKARTAVANRTN